MTKKWTPTDLQRRCLKALLILESNQRHRFAFSPNEIGFAAKAKAVTQTKWRYQNKGPAQQIIRPLTALRDRGLILSCRRDDQMSGSAYRLSAAGRKLALDL